MENKSYIYLIKNLIEDKIVYIGQHNGNNKYYKGSGHILKKYLKKYGCLIYEQMFKKEIIEYCPVELLDNKEIYWIKFYDTYKNGFNLTEGGKTLSKCTVKNKSFPEKGKKLKGRKRSESTKELLRLKMKDFKPNMQCHQKCSEKLSKPVLQYNKQGNFIKEWKNASTAELFYNEKAKFPVNISAACLNHQHTAYGFMWFYKTDDKYDKLIKQQKRKKYKKRETSAMAKPINVEGINYKSLKQAYTTLKINEGKFRNLMKGNKIKYKWL